MTQSSKATQTFARDLTEGEWIVTQFGASIVQAIHDYGNGWVALDLSDGQHLDCLAYRQFSTL